MRFGVQVIIDETQRKECKSIGEGAETVGAGLLGVSGYGHTRGCVVSQQSAITRSFYGSTIIRKRKSSAPPPPSTGSRLSLLKRALCLLRSEAAVHGAASGPAELGIRPSTIYQCYAFTDTKAARGRQAETSPRGSPARAIAELHSGGLIARRDP